jgi:pimeloyl-ACP methyl ester carboxylesterase
MASSPADDDSALRPLLEALARAPERRPAAPRRRLDPGTRIGRYAIVAHLGDGGMSSVYRARDPELDREVALKVLHEEPHGDRLARFEQEARALAALSHPSIVAIHDVGRHDGRSFLALELLEGETMRQRLRRGPLDLSTALGCAAATLAALAAAHEQGIVHRDLKPENLFLTRAGVLKVLDFGLAKRVISIGAPRSRAADVETEAGMLLGTVGYMAPEQLRGESVDARTDLFALGAVLHELLSGERAFAGANSVETMYRILTDVAAPLDELVPTVPAAVAACVERCLASDPADRFASAHEVAAALVAAAQVGPAGDGVPAPRPRRGSPPTTRYARSGDVHIGYQVVGDGPVTVVIVPGFVSSIEQLWDDPDCARFLLRVGGAARLVLFDKRGTGLSDRTVVESKAQTVEHRSDDIRAVLDDVGVERVVLLGISEGASIAIRFAVTYPERVAALALYGGYAVFRANPGVAALVDAVRDGWGTGRTLEVFGPSAASDPAKRRWWARWERLSASPGAVATHLEVLTRLDVTALLGLVRVPTLVLHRSGDRIVPLSAGQFLADRIPGATLRVHPGDDHLFMLGDADRLARDLLAFIEATGDRVPAPRPAAAIAVVVTSAGDELVIPGPSALEVVEHVLELVARTGGRAAVQLEAPGADSAAARALACARGAVVHAAPGEVLVTGELRGSSWGHGYVHEDRGIHAAVDGAQAVRLFAIRRAARPDT